MVKLDYICFYTNKNIMQQVYHSNATTNHNIRTSIQLYSSISNVDLAAKFNTSVNTISKWKDRDFIEDLSSRPININYALTDIEKHSL